MDGRGRSGKITSLPLGDRAPRRRNVLRPLGCPLERSSSAGLGRASCILDGPLISLTRVSGPAKDVLLLLDVSLKAHGPFRWAVATWAQNTIQRPDPAGGLRFGVTPRRPPLR